MRIKNVFLAIVMVLILIISFSGCGSKDNSASEQQESTAPVVEQQATPEEEVVEQVIATPDPSTSVDSLLGSWVDVSAQDRFVNITKKDAGYEYEDNEGKLPAIFENGTLKVKVSDTETADIHIDKETGNLISVYQDNISEYKKK
jgi:predicted small lipoprotein YifL